MFNLGTPKDERPDLPFAPERRPRGVGFQG